MKSPGKAFMTRDTAEHNSHALFALRKKMNHYNLLEPELYSRILGYQSFDPEIHTVKYAIETSNIVMLSVLLSDYSGDLFSTLMNAENVSEKVLDALLQQNHISAFQASMSAAREGHVEMIQLDSVTNEVFECASLEGRLNVVQYLVENTNVDVTANSNFAVLMAAIRGHLDVVQYLVENTDADVTDNYNYAIQEAASRGHLRMVQYLVENTGADVTDNNNSAIQDAAAEGHLDVVQYMAENTNADVTALNNCAIQAAASNGHLKVVQYLMESTNADVTAGYNFAIKLAAAQGHLEVVQYIVEANPDDDQVKDALSAALVNRQTELIRYLVDYTPF